MKKTILFLFANIFIFSFFSCAQKLPVQKLTVTTQKRGQVCVLAEVAKTQAQRNRGFMERKNILFLFKEFDIGIFTYRAKPLTGRVAKYGVELFFVVFIEYRAILL